MKDKHLKDEIGRHLTTIANQRVKIGQLEARIDSLLMLACEINADRDRLREKVK